MYTKNVSGILFLLMLFKVLPAQVHPVTVWNPFDLQFTRDNKYLLVNSPNDSKIWNLQNGACIPVLTDFYKDPGTNNNSWSYFDDTHSFYFHQSIGGDEILSIQDDGKSLSPIASIGKDIYREYQYNNPPTFLLTQETVLCIRKDKHLLPKVYVEKTGASKPLLVAKLEDNKTIDTDQRYFHVLKGSEDLYYLLSFRSKEFSSNSEGMVTEINLSKGKTRVLAKGLMVFTGEGTEFLKRVEKLKLSTETPNFILLHLDDFVYVIRKSDGKVLENLNISKSFPSNSYPEVCGERDGKLLVRYYDISEQGGILFSLFDFDNLQKLNDVMKFPVNILQLRALRIALSRDGLQYAIACETKSVNGFTVAYFDGSQLKYLTDPAHLVENFLKEQELAKQRNQLLKIEKTKELSKKPKEEVISRNWYAIIDKNNDHFGMGMKLTVDQNGTIHGTFEYRKSPSGMDHYRWYDAIYELSGKFISQNKISLEVIGVKHSHAYFEDQYMIPKLLTFQISLNPETNLFSLYSEDWQGYFPEGFLDSHYF